MHKLDRAFYERPTLEVARDILGKYFVYESPEGRLAARIVEVEAYIGEDDPARHASAGLTERTRPMFGPGGFTYVYFIYGMYHCLNLVTEKKGSPAALLVRAGEPADGYDVMRGPASGKDRNSLLAGPGKFCRAMGLTRSHNNLDLIGPVAYVEDRGSTVKKLKQTPRVGISTAKERPWRFVDADSPALSRKLDR